MPDASLSATLSVAALAAVIEWRVGYPAPVFAWIGHPVMWIGALIGRLDRLGNRPGWSSPGRRAAGFAALAIVVAVPVGLACGAVWLMDRVLPRGLAILLQAVAAGTLVAQRSLHDHVADVGTGLRGGGLAGGRAAVGRIVGRDTAGLDRAGIVRAAIESLAENFSDGVVAPLLWTALLGLPGAVFYKAVNTADSMIGHLTPRHAAFGFAAARLDDGINLPASRLSALWIFLAAPRARRGAVWRALRDDARHHRSPNAGWPEAAMAGALGLRLAGPRLYGGVRVQDAWMGDGTPDADIGHLDRALVLYRRACRIERIVIVALAVYITVL
ncbi:cobalamin biosynthesis protein CobD [Gluconacetobacter diazotrophicus]|uniref:Cobalamin biosynthesis protein CobD n=1 Tax=Gluconacetobacter diazotrophicus TaxID=33996 RepID=A0A7W4FCC7_GLUDI|nr:adenosylcobinamide-phosphate synthase CbiB [Gluconacetobacter diazotrophicus]MBB2155153.1 cobalamin biosynthesis protein CobD [Gluconacetobacter diazotrophicus]